MSFIHHTIKRWGHGYTIEDDKGPRTSNVETHVQVDGGGVGTREGLM